MQFNRPKGLFAGFHANFPDPGVPELVHAGEQWAPVDFFIAEHDHTVWEFYYQVAGESEWVGDGERAVLRPGDFFAAAPRVKHRMRERPKTRHHFLYAAINMERVFGRHKALRKAWRGRRVASVPHAETLEAPFRQLIREISTPLPHREIGMRAALDFLAIAATRLLEQDREAEPFRCAHPAVMRAREMLDHHPAQHWSLPDLARFSGLSPSRFSECFARDLGMTPHQYLLKARVEAAKEALARSDVSITDLAMELGFSSSQHFASTFRRLAGVSARAFRQSALRR